MRENVVRALVLETVAAAALAFIACGGSKKEETIATEQGSSVETRAGRTVKVGEPKMDETTKAGETKVDVSKKDDKAADAKESVMVGTLDEVRNFAFILVNEKGTAHRFTFEQDKTPEGLSDVKADDKVTATCTGTISETNSFEGMAVSVKKA